MKSEIEVKAKVKNLEFILLKLKELGCALSKPIVQDDYIYNVKGVDLKDHSHNTPVLRIRKQENKIIFTVKKNRCNELDCIEKEVFVDNIDVLKDIFELLGYEQSVEVHKKRQKGKINDYEICLDDVKNLGLFIEVEKMSEEDGKKVQTELFDFLKKLGINEEDRVSIGYDSLIWLKNNSK